MDTDKTAAALELLNGRVDEIDTEKQELRDTLEKARYTVNSAETRIRDLDTERTATMTAIKSLGGDR